MRRGTRAAADGSFGRSAGAAALRGALLILAAVVLGVVLLQATDDVEPFTAAEVVLDEGATTDTTAPVTTDTSAADEGGDDAAPADTTSTTGAAEARPPGEVRVLVANATRVQGAAGRFQEQLEGVGYNALAPVDTTTKPLDSVVYFAPGFEAEAQALAASLSPSPPVAPLPAEPPVQQIGEADTLLVVGAELAG